MFVAAIAFNARSNMKTGSGKSAGKPTGGRAAAASFVGGENWWTQCAAESAAEDEPNSESHPQAPALAHCQEIEEMNYSASCKGYELYWTEGDRPGDVQPGTHIHLFPPFFSVIVGFELTAERHYRTGSLSTVSFAS